MSKNVKITALLVGIVIGVYSFSNLYIYYIKKCKTKFYINNICKNNNQEYNYLLKILSDSIKNRANQDLFFYKQYKNINDSQWQIDTCFYVNLNKTKFYFYVSDWSCSNNNCSSEIIEYHLENINNKYYLSSAGGLTPVPSDYNLPQNKPIPFKFLSKIAMDYSLPTYLKQKHWWNPFDFEINEELFKYSFLSDKLSDSQKIERYTIDWAFGDRQPR